MRRLLLIGLFLSLISLGCQLVSPDIPVEPTPSMAPPTPTVTPTAATPAPTVPPPTASATPTAIQSNQPITITAITMLDQAQGWAIGEAGKAIDSILRTADGGKTWSDVTPGDAILRAEQGSRALAHFHDNDLAWVIYSTSTGRTPAQSVVWRTQDQGNTWQPSQALDLDGLENIFDPSHLQFVDDRTGWLLAHVGVGMSHDYVALFKSSDSGQTWDRILDPYNDGGIQACAKNSLLFTDAEHGWLTGTCSGVAAGVLLFRTIDGGQTWQDVMLPPPPAAQDLYTSFDLGCSSDYPTFLTPKHGFIAVDCEHLTEDPRTTDHFLFFTANGGDTWTSSLYPGGALRFFDLHTGLALGQEIYKTEDAGINWTKISVLSWDGRFDFPIEGVGWAVAQSGEQVALVFSQDGGQYWAIIQPVLAP